MTTRFTGAIALIVLLAACSPAPEKPATQGYTDPALVPLTAHDITVEGTFVTHTGQLPADCGDANTDPLSLAVLQRIVSDARVQVMSKYTVYQEEPAAAERIVKAAEAKLGRVRVWASTLNGCQREYAESWIDFYQNGIGDARDEMETHLERDATRDRQRKSAVPGDAAVRLALKDVPPIARLTVELPTGPTTDCCSIYEGIGLSGVVTVTPDPSLEDCRETQAKGYAIACASDIPQALHPPLAPWSIGPGDAINQLNCHAAPCEALPNGEISCPAVAVCDQPTK